MLTLSRRHRSINVPVYLQLAAIMLAAFIILQALPFISPVVITTVHADTGTGVVSLTALDTGVTEPFDTLATAGTTNTTLPTGWYITETGGGARDNEQYAVDNGGSNTGDTYSYGSAGPPVSTERALGGLRSGTLISVFGAKITNNTGSTITSLDISYTGEEWRLGTAGRADQIDFQISTNATDLSTGTYTDVNALDFVTPNTVAPTGAKDGNVAPNRTVITSTITPLTIANGASFFIRWTDLDASGADDGLAVDDITITPHGGGTQPVLSINDATVTEGNSGTVTATFTVSLSAPAGAGGVTFDIATQDNTATDADNDYEPFMLTGESIPQGGTSKMYNVTVNGDTTPEPTETFFVNVTNVSAGATLGDGQGTGTITNDDISAGPLRIHDIQGASHLSPHATEAVTNVPGIVTAKRTAAADGSKGFYLQDPTPDADDATSEGIFVFTTNTTILNSVNVGDSVLVSGTVSEFRPGGAASANLTVTEISGPTVTPISTGNPLPAAIIVGTGGRIPPMDVIEDDSAGDVETSNVFDPASDGIDFYESLEHMRVQVNNAEVVGPTATFGSGFPDKEVYVVGDNGAHASVRTPRGGIVIRPNDFNPERIVVTNLFQTLADLNVSDTFTNPIVGIYDYNFGKFLLHATSVLTTASGGLNQEVAALPAANQLTIATFNVENLDPNDPPAKFSQLADIVVDNLRSPDLITVEEIQDNNGATNDSVVDATVTFNTLITAIQTTGGPTYEFRQINPVDDQDGGEPGGNIRVGFLFRTDRGLSFIDRTGGTSTSAVSVVSGMGGPELSFSPGRIDPTNPAFNSSRKPLAGEFLYNGRKLFVIGNHFNSKGGDDPTYGRHQPPMLSSETQRLQQAQIVNNFVDSILAQDAKANIVVLGDINDFHFSAPLAMLKGGVLHDLIETLPVNERYTYDFQGNSQSLDHILVSNGLFNTIFKYDAVHVNSEFAVRASDHDPQVAYFSFIRRNNAFQDFDGDGKTGFAVFRPNSDGAGHGRWYILNSGTSTVTEQQFGDATDIIVPGDYDGNGSTDIAVFRPSEGAWYISQGSAQNFLRREWGQNGDVPVPADYDGDGKTDLAVLRPSTNTWYIRRSSDNGTSAPQWGVSGDKPVPGDYDGDTKADVAVWRPSTGTWYIQNTSDGSTTSQQWGNQSLGDIAVPGDYDGDGKTDVAVWRSSTGAWLILKSTDGMFIGPQWGVQTDVPVPGDYDGDFKTDVAVWRPSNGTWFVLRSSDGGTTGVHWGNSGDEPVPSAYIKP